MQSSVFNTSEESLNIASGDISFDNRSHFTHSQRMVLYCNQIYIDALISYKLQQMPL